MPELYNSMLSTTRSLRAQAHAKDMGYKGTP